MGLRFWQKWKKKKLKNSKMVRKKMCRLFFKNRRVLRADAMEKVRYSLDPRIHDECTLGNRKAVIE